MPDLSDKCLPFTAHVLIIYWLIVSAEHNCTLQTETQLGFSQKSTGVEGENCNHISGPKQEKVLVTSHRIHEVF